MTPPGANRRRSFLLHITTMVATVVVQRRTVFQQGVELKIPVIKLLAQQEVAACVRAAATLFHHIDIAMAVAVEVVGGITGVLDEGVLIQREHIVRFKAPHFHLPVVLLTKEENRVVEVHRAGHIRQRLDRETGKIAVIRFADTVEAEQDTAV